MGEKGNVASVAAQGSGGLVDSAVDVSAGVAGAATDVVVEGISSAGSEVVHDRIREHVDREPEEAGDTDEQPPV